MSDPPTCIRSFISSHKNMDPKKPTTLGKEQPKLERKPSIRTKQAPPLVRQTLTSSRRILKAINPLAKFVASKPSLASTFSQSTKPLTTGTVLKQTQGSSAPSCSEPKQLTGTTTTLRRTQSVKETRPKTFNQPQSSSNFKRPQSIRESIQIHKKTGTDFNRKSTVALKPGIECRRPQWKPQLPSASKPKPELKQKQNVDQFLKRPSMNPHRKKSMSSDHIQTKNNKPRLNESQSVENIQYVPTPADDSEEADKNLVFKTPSAYRRRSIYHHLTPSSNRKFVNYLIASSPGPDEMLLLQDRLNKWLKSRGKPPAEFHNLNKIVSKIVESDTNCVSNTTINEIEEQNKENIEVVNCLSESYEDLKINTMPEEDIFKIAKEATVDLIKLVELGYPTSECLKLLDLIREKCEKIVDAPEYWELLACVDEAEGNIFGAMDHLSTAIIQGADIPSVDTNLDLLLQKFSSLNISPSKIIHQTKEEVELRVNARDVFKSRIILIAIREREAKKKQGKEAPQKQFIATPVRRSTRLSTSAYKNSPGLTLCRSLKQADNSTDISFAKNKALI